MRQHAAALRRIFLLRYPGGVPRPRDPMASWERPRPHEPLVPDFVPGAPDGSYEHPVVEPASLDLDTAIPSLRGAAVRNRNEHERILVTVEHE